MEYSVGDAIQVSVLHAFIGTETSASGTSSSNSCSEASMRIESYRCKVVSIPQPRYAVNFATFWIAPNAMQDLHAFGAFQKLANMFVLLILHRYSVIISCMRGMRGCNTFFRGRM